MPETSRIDYTAAGGGRSSLQPLDNALEYLCGNLSRLLPGYLLAMAPFSAAMVYVIDAVASQHRSALPVGCLMLIVATLWRWAWISRVQRMIQWDFRGEPPIALRRRLPAIMIIRLVACLGLTWGGVLILPPLYAMFLAGFAAPILLEKDGAATAQTLEACSWIQGAMGRLVKLSTVLGLLGVVMLLSVFIMESLVVSLILPSFLGMENPDLVLTLGSTAWNLGLCYAVFLVFDLYWTVASVFLFYDLQARRLGSDLRQRLQQMLGGQT